MGHPQTARNKCKSLSFRKLFYLKLKFKSTNYRIIYGVVWYINVTQTNQWYSPKTLCPDDEFGSDFTCLHSSLTSKSSTVIMNFIFKQYYFHFESKLQIPTECLNYSSIKNKLICMWLCTLKDIHTYLNCLIALLLPGY